LDSLGKLRLKSFLLKAFYSMPCALQFLGEGDKAAFLGLGGAHHRLLPVVGFYAVCYRSKGLVNSNSGINLNSCSPFAAAL